MDRKLLLTLQWACNKKGVKLPWASVAREMGENITESAVIQHLAKLRQRMVNDNLPVPPPLTRGGRIAKAEKAAAKQPAAYRVTKRAAKKKIINSTEDETDSDGEYHYEEETAKYPTKKGEKKAGSNTPGNMPSRLMEESSSHEYPSSRIGSNTQGKVSSRVMEECSSQEYPRSRTGPNTHSNVLSHLMEESSSHEYPRSRDAAVESRLKREIGEPSYAVGDNMWDLAARPTARSKVKRAKSKGPGQSPIKATKVVKLKISPKGLPKLILYAKRPPKPAQTGPIDDYSGRYSGGYSEDVKQEENVDASAESNHNDVHDIAPEGQETGITPGYRMYDWMPPTPNFFGAAFEGADTANLGDPTTNDYDMVLSLENPYQGSMAGPYAAGDDYAAFNTGANDSMYRVDHRQHGHAEHGNQEVPASANESQSMGNRVLGSPFQGDMYKPTGHDNSFDPWL